MPHPLAIWAALQSAVQAAFSPASAYGGPALCGALAFSALYYVRRRRARGGRISATGLPALDFSATHPPPSLVAHRHAPMGSERDRIRVRLWHARLWPVLLARRHRRLADARIRGACTCPLASLGDPRARDRAADPGLRARLLVRPLRLSQGPGALGVPQGPPFRRGDDDLDRTAPASGRDHRVHELDRARDRNRIRRHDLYLWSGRPARTRCSTATFSS